MNDDDDDDDEYALVERCVDTLPDCLTCCLPATSIAIFRDACMPYPASQNSRLGMLPIALKALLITDCCRHFGSSSTFTLLNCFLKCIFDIFLRWK
ncbi:hypothetical protein T4D_16274 [Trichinella pseudospiralis]|uniref:Uncharacterized protein n=1 Tax=Trichinella pseudospiralis TaxID=6337 RepID=A0A0V1FHM7_TRIPS|nr:hypothetical protein T4D_16274 [Trichinella pseudospiralis]